MSTDRRPKATRRPIPATWKVLMDQKAIPSIRRLAEKAGIDHVTATRTVYGDREPGEVVIQAIAKALEIDMKTAYRLMGRPASYVEPWNPPALSARLDKEQRRALEDLIYVMVEGHRPGMTARPTIGDASTSREEMMQPGDVHPEQDDMDLAADESHGLSQWQKWEDGDD